MAPNETTWRALARALAPEHDLDRLDENREIEQQAPVLDVVQVVLKLLERILFGRAVRVAELCPPGDAGLHAVALAVVRDRVLEVVHELRSLRTWADEAHVAAEHVQQLWQLVEPRLAEKG